MAASAIPAKIVGIELSGVLQLAFFSLAQQDNINMLLTPLMGMKDFNGRNLQETEAIPNRVSAIDYEEPFIRNCNLMLYIVFGLLGLGIVLFFLTFVCINAYPKAHKISKHILK